MSRTAYVNGQYVPLSEALVNIEDRGYQFSDGVYEGVAVRHGVICDLEPHLDRLGRSMDGIQLEAPMARAPLRLILKEVVRRNKTRDGFLYIQVTRGVAKRNHAFPDFVPPALTITCHRLDFDRLITLAKKGVAAHSTPDIRWGRCDLKTISLLPNILAKQEASVAGAFEAIMLDGDGYVTEGSSTNIWMVGADNTLITRSTSDNILPGIARHIVKEIAGELDLSIETRAFSLKEALAAREVFLTSTTSCAMPITIIDGKKIGAGQPGKVATALLKSFVGRLDQQA